MLDGVGVARLRLVGVETSAASGPSLAQEVPTLVQGFLHPGETALLVLVEAVNAGCLVKSPLLGNQAADVIEDLVVVHVTGLLDQLDRCHRDIEDAVVAQNAQDHGLPDGVADHLLLEIACRLDLGVVDAEDDVLGS